MNADSLETSQVIINAIEFLATADRPAMDIWVDPTNEEYIAIWEIVTVNGARDPRNFCWGASGDEWAESFDEKFGSG